MRHIGYVHLKDTDAIRFNLYETNDGYVYGEPGNQTKIIDEELIEFLRTRPFYYFDVVFDIHKIYLLNSLDE